MCACACVCCVCARELFLCGSTEALRTTKRQNRELLSVCCARLWRCAFPSRDSWRSVWRACERPFTRGRQFNSGTWQAATSKFRCTFVACAADRAFHRGCTDTQRFAAAAATVSAVAGDNGIDNGNDDDDAAFC